MPRSEKAKCRCGGEVQITFTEGQPVCSTCGGTLGDAGTFHTAQLSVKQPRPSGRKETPNAR